jgi:hypothetical protein
MVQLSATRMMLPKGLPTHVLFWQKQAPQCVAVPVIWHRPASANCFFTNLEWRPASILFMATMMVTLAALAWAMVLWFAATHVIGTTTSTTTSRPGRRAPAAVKAHVRGVPVGVRCPWWFNLISPMCWGDSACHTTATLYSDGIQQGGFSMVYMPEMVTTGGLFPVSSRLHSIIHWASGECHHRFLFFTSSFSIRLQSHFTGNHTAESSQSLIEICMTPLDMRILIIEWGCINLLPVTNVIFTVSMVFTIIAHNSSPSNLYP